MYRNNIYTKPGLTGFGNYQGVGALTQIQHTALKTNVSATATPPATGIEAIPTWAFIAVPVGVVALAAALYYKFG